MKYGPIFSYIWSTRTGRSGKEYEIRRTADKRMIGRGAAATTSSSGYPFVLYHDYLLDTVTEEAFESILQHEIGHFECKHDLTEEAIFKEFEADEYVAAIYLDKDKVFHMYDELLHYFKVIGTNPLVMLIYRAHFFIRRQKLKRTEL